MEFLSSYVHHRLQPARSAQTSQDLVLLFAALTWAHIIAEASRRRGGEDRDPNSLLQ